MTLSPTAQSPVLPSYRIRNKIVDPPAALPVDLADMKTYLRVTTAADDTLITMLMEMATQVVQDFLGRVLITTGFEGFADNKFFPSIWWSGEVVGAQSNIFNPTRIFEMPWLPFAAFEELAYITLGGDVVVVDPANYIVDTSSNDMPGRVALKYFATTLEASQEINAYRLRWTSGYGATDADVPAALKLGVMRTVAFLYENRGDCGCSGEELLKASGAHGVLGRYRVLRI